MSGLFIRPFLLGSALFGLLGEAALLSQLFLLGGLCFLELLGDCVLDRRLNRGFLLFFVLEIREVFSHVHLAMFQVI